MQRPNAVFSSRLALATQPTAPSSPPSFARRTFQSDRLYTPSQHLRDDPHRPSNYRGSAAIDDDASTMTRPFTTTERGTSYHHERPTTAAVPLRFENEVPSRNTGWTRRNTDPPRGSRVYESYSSNPRVAAPSSTAIATTIATTKPTTFPALSRLSPHARPSSAATASSSVAGGASRAVSQPQPQPQSFTTPLRSTARPATTASVDARWGRLGNDDATSAAPTSFNTNAPPPPMQLRLSHLSVAAVDLRAAKAAVGPLLLRGSLGESVLPFCTDGVWPTLERGWSDDRQRIDAVQTFAASWPETAAQAVAIHLPAPSTAPTTAPPGFFVCECYVSNTPPNAPPSLRSEAFVGRSRLTLAELVEAASDDASTPTPLEAVLRDDDGAVVGRLACAVALLPPPQLRRVVRVTDVSVLPDPLQADDDNYNDDSYSGRQRGSRTMLPAAELALALAAPSSAAVVAAGESPAVPADARTPATVRWTALPAFSFYDTSSVPATEEAEEDGQGVGQRTSAPLSVPLAVGELFYCPLRPPLPSGGGGRSLSGQRGSAARVLLGTFAIPLPPPSSSSSSAGYAHRYRSSPHAGVVAAYPFQVPLRTSAEGGRWMAMGDCWVRGVVETWTEATEAEETGRSAVTPSSSFAVAEYADSATRTTPASPPAPPPAVRDATALSPRPPPPPPSSSLLSGPPPPATAATTTTLQEDVALQRVRERQEALIQRVEFRLAEVREQRQHLRDEMAAQDAQATAEENAIAEEYGLVEGELGEAEAAYREATKQLAELQQLHADRAADHNAYLAEQTRALEDVARERAEAVELRAQLEALQTQMRAHMAAEQQRYAARVEHTRAALGRVEANTKWLTEVEAKIAASESEQSRRAA